jgi:threonine dehydrogenase-like Zn-dependent dehydrogenase
MKAIAITPHTKDVRLIDCPEPAIEKPTQVKVRVLQVGICGTDREEVSGGRADAPAGEKQLIIGHEMLGKVAAVGSAVKAVAPGDLVVITVRRPCSTCSMCKQNCADLCESGLYTERGIKQRHGFQCEYVVDEEQFLVKVPSDLESVAVLTEPTTVVEKAIDRACRLQCARQPGNLTPEKWLKGKRALVAGIGTVGLLGAMILRLRGAEVFGMDRVPEGSLRPQILKAMGGHYLTGELQGDFDLIVEATGVGKVQFELFPHIAANGVYVLTGIGESSVLSIDSGKMDDDIVLKNKIILGSVNAGKEDFQQAVADLAAAKKKWPGIIEKFLTHQAPFTQFQELFSQRNPDEIKAVIRWTNP